MLIPNLSAFITEFDPRNLVEPFLGTLIPGTQVHVLNALRELRNECFAKGAAYLINAHTMKADNKRALTDSIECMQQGRWLDLFITEFERKLELKSLPSSKL